MKDLKWSSGNKTTIPISEILKWSFGDDLSTLSVKVLCTGDCCLFGRLVINLILNLLLN